MKYTVKRFTLVEMLVVMGIIATLAGLLMPTIVSVRRQAKKTKAKAEMHSIITAVKTYEMTYGILPTVEKWANGGTGIGYNNLISALTDLDTDRSKVVASSYNTRGIRFLDVPDDYIQTNDGFVDPWNNKYKIYMDTDYDGEIAAGSPIDETLYGTVFIYTLAGGANADKVYSWK